MVQIAAKRLEMVLGPYLVVAGAAWTLDEEWDEEGICGCYY